MSNTRVLKCFDYFSCSINNHSLALDSFARGIQVDPMSSTKNRKFDVIQSQFACAVPVKKIDWQVCPTEATFPPAEKNVNKRSVLQFQNVLEELMWDDQQILLQQTVKWPLLEKYPLQVKYVIRFLRHIIDALESRNEEIHDDLYEIFCDYQAKATQLDNGVYSFKHYRIECDRNSELVTLKENHNKISQGTTGLNVWEAALALCEWSLSNKSTIRDKHVLELGAGTGLSGLVIGKCCQPTSITLTDGDDNVLNYLRENVRNNFHENEEGNHSKGGTAIGRRNHKFKFNCLAIN